MTLEFKQGEIIKDSCFQYPDSDRFCDKFLFVLNKTHDQLDDLILVPCTSKVYTDSLDDGCNEIKQVFFFPSGSNFLELPTALQFHSLVNLSYEDVEYRFKEGTMKRKNQYLTVEELQQVLSCLKKLEQDIPKEFYDVIF